MRSVQWHGVLRVVDRESALKILPTHSHYQDVASDHVQIARMDGKDAPAYRLIKSCISEATTPSCATGQPRAPPAEQSLASASRHSLVSSPVEPSLPLRQHHMLIGAITHMTQLCLLHHIPLL